MSGGGGGKPEQVKASEGEKIQAQLARDQINYYRGTYAPLEQQFLSEAGQDHSARLAGQNGSAAMRESTDTLRQAALSTAPVDTAALGTAITSGRVAGLAQGRRERDDGRLEGLGVGLGITADATKSLSQAGQIQTESAIDRTREQLAKMQAKNDLTAAKWGAVGTLAGAGVSYYGLNRLGARQTTQDKANATASLMTTRIANGTAYRDARGIY